MEERGVDVLMNLLREKREEISQLSARELTSLVCGGAVTRSHCKHER